MIDRMPSTSGAVLAVCFATAMIEGFDIQSAGVAAPAMIKDFALDPRQTGLVFTASTVGLLIGAFLGGRIADLIGRKAAIMISLGAVMIFTCGTAAVGSFGGLLTMRLLAGLGMGGAMPGLIAVAAETAPPHKVRSAVAAVYAGFPAGGAVVSLFSLLELHGGWRAIFVLGGLLPLAVLVAIAALLHLPASANIQQDRAAERASIVQTLFADRRLPLTFALWLALFSSLLVLYVMQNWLPTLLNAKAFDRAEAGIVQFLMNVGGAIGCYCIGQLMDRYSRTGVVIANTFILAASLAVMATVAVPIHAFLTALPLGLALNACQAILYSLAPTVYPASMRGTGVGAAISIARLGSVTGPLLASALLMRGATAETVLLSLLPVVALAGGATVLLVLRQRQQAAASNL